MLKNSKILLDEYIKHLDPANLEDWEKARALETLFADIFQLDSKAFWSRAMAHALKGNPQNFCEIFLRFPFATTPPMIESLNLSTIDVKKIPTDADQLLT